MKQKDKKIAIIGSGITGLTIAYKLKKAQIPFVVFEKENRIGGVINTIAKNGFVFETGPNSGVLSNSSIVQLLDDLNEYSQKEIASKNAAKRLIWKGTQWHALPSGLLSGITTPLFSWKDKIRILGEPFRHKGINPLENLSSLVKRRLGNSFLDYAVDPFILGIYAGDPQYIVPKYALPKLYNLEQKYGSFIGGAIKKRKEPKADNQDKVTREIFSMKGGLQKLIDALEQAVGKENIKTNCNNLLITPNRVGYQVSGNNNLSGQFTHIVSTVNPAEYKALFPFLKQNDLDIFMRLPYAKVTGVTIGFNNWEGMPLNAFGGLIPFKEDRNILGVLFMSSMFKNRAPENGALLNIFMGGMRKPEIAELSDDKIKQILKEELSELMQIKNFNPDLVYIKRYSKAIAQYGSDSEERLKTIAFLEQKFPGFIFAGSIKDGVGIADRVQQASNIAGQIIEG